MEISNFTQQEKVFLAGSVKVMMLTHAGIAEEELQDLDRITEKLGFNDFGNTLEQFESLVKDTESYWEMAKEITRDEVCEDILGILTELSMQEGFPSGTEQQMIRNLKQVWNKE